MGRPRNEDRPSAGIQSVEIAFSVLDMVRKADGALSLTQLSDLTRLSPSKLHRYLVSLNRCGMIAQSPVTGRYDLGPSARTIGAVALKRFDGFEVVSEQVTALSETMGHSAFIYIWIEIGPVLIKICSPGRTEFNLRVGSSIPLVGSACGPVFLAHLPAEVTEPVLRRSINQLRQPKTKQPDKAGIEALRKAVRQQPVYWTEESVLPGYGAGAAPIFGSDGRLFCVVGIAVASNDPAEEKRVKASLADLAANLSSSLGYAGRREDA